MKSPMNEQKRQIATCFKSLWVFMKFKRLEKKYPKSLFQIPVGFHEIQVTGKEVEKDKWVSNPCGFS